MLGQSIDGDIIRSEHYIDMRSVYTVSNLCDFPTTRAPVLLREPRLHTFQVEYVTAGQRTWCQVGRSQFIQADGTIIRVIVARRNASSALPLTPSPLMCLFRTLHTYLYRIIDLVLFRTL